MYTSPTKSLSNQKYAEFTEKFGATGSVGIMTGDIKMNPDAQCIIMTTEILRNILYRDATKQHTESEHTNDLSLININDVGAVIFDEVHYINDKDRGKVWEESIVLLPKNITLVMLSATIDKPELFASWIGNMKEKNISLIPTSHRVVPLKHYFWKSYPYIDSNGKDCIKWELLEILDDKGKFKNYDVVRKNYEIHDVNKLMDNLVDYLVDNNHIPALFFKFSRKKCETICKTVRRNLLTFEEIAQVENTFDFYMKNYKKTYEILPQYQDVYSQLKKGVVYHHSGLIPILKEIIEILYGKGLIKILFATETFAIGVNASTKVVLFSDLEKYDNNGLRELRSDEYLQCAGRSGRRGLDKFGSIIILPTMTLPSELSMKSMMIGKSPSINSKFQLSYQFVLKTLASNDFDLDKFLSKTLIMNQNDKIANSIINENSDLEQKIKDITLSEEELTIIKKYDILDKKMNDTFFVIKKKDKEKMEKVLGGISQMGRTPAALFIVDISHEHIALAEAKRLGISTFAMVDTNSDPSKVDFSIPSNDDASKSISIITNYLTAAIMEGLQERAENKEAADEEQGEEATESKGRKNELDEETEGADGKKTRSAKPAAGGAGRPKQGAGRPKAASKKI